MKTTIPYTPSDWALLPGGKNALLRFPLSGNLSDLTTPPTGSYRLATQAEIVAMNYGAPYPWGWMPDNSKPTKMWQDYRIGYGGLIHSAWFVLANGERVGGAPNVPDTGQGARRHYLLTSGGSNDTPEINDNEGFAVVWEEVPSVNEHAYRTIHDHIASHVTADRGGAIISPILNAGDTIYVGFIGRCMTCPNPERISIGALQSSCPSLAIALHPSWRNWQV